MLQNLYIRRIFALIISIIFTVNGLSTSWAEPQGLLELPAVGASVVLSPSFAPAVIKGIKIHPENPFRFDFVLDKGNAKFEDSQLKEESKRLIKYFLASLTIPEEDLWVNLSPYEQNRIIPEAFGQTQMGRDFLALDYVLKQLNASLTDPRQELGKAFWSKVYQEASARFKTTSLPVSTFNKVWIVPDQAEVSTFGNTAFVTGSHLKVMMEQDYLALKNNKSHDATQNLTTQIMRSIILPAVEQEVNQGKNFARLRQIFNSLILAAWFKRNLKDSFLGKAYVDAKKIAGVDLADKTQKEKIYQLYLKAFKKGVYNYIQEEPVALTGLRTPRRYFSGGIDSAQIGSMLEVYPRQVSELKALMGSSVNLAMIDTETTPVGISKLGIQDDLDHQLKHLRSTRASSSREDILATLREMQNRLDLHMKGLSFEEQIKFEPYYLTFYEHAIDFIHEGEAQLDLYKASEAIVRTTKHFEEKDFIRPLRTRIIVSTLGSILIAKIDAMIEEYEFLIIHPDARDAIDSQRVRGGIGRSKIAQAGRMLIIGNKRILGMDNIDGKQIAHMDLPTVLWNMRYYSNRNLDNHVRVLVQGLMKENGEEGKRKALGLLEEHFNNHCETTSQEFITMKFHYLEIFAFLHGEDEVWRILRDDRDQLEESLKRENGKSSEELLRKMRLRFYLKSVNFIHKFVESKQSVTVLANDFVKYIESFKPRTSWEYLNLAKIYINAGNLNKGEQIYDNYKKLYSEEYAVAFAIKDLKDGNHSEVAYLEKKIEKLRAKRASEAMLTAKLTKDQIDGMDLNQIFDFLKQKNRFSLILNRRNVLLKELFEQGKNEEVFDWVKKFLSTYEHNFGADQINLYTLGMKALFSIRKGGQDQINPLTKAIQLRDQFNKEFEILQITSMPFKTRNAIERYYLQYYWEIIQLIKVEGGSFALQNIQNFVKPLLKPRFKSSTLEGDIYLAAISLEVNRNDLANYWLGKYNEIRKKKEERNAGPYLLRPDLLTLLNHVRSVLGDSPAMVVVSKDGGIDFNPAMLNIKTHGVVPQMNAGFNPSLMQNIQFDGLETTILSITPMDLNAFCGSAK